MLKAIPSLSITGWIRDLAAEADYILACYITTQASDSVLHYQQNTSMQYILKRHAGNFVTMQEEMANDIRSKLQTIFGATADAVVEISAEDKEKPDNFTIRFTGTVYDNSNQSYVVGRLVLFENGKFVKISKINNG